MTKIRTPEPLSSSAEANRLHPSILPTPTSIQHHQRATVRKPRRPLSEDEQRQRAADREEMQSLLAKLKQLVPGIPKRRKLSKLEIIQHVIDYIFDLQVALESHPLPSSAAAAAMEFINYQLSMSQQQQQQQQYLYQQPQSAESSVVEPRLFQMEQQQQLTSCDLTSSSSSSLSYQLYDQSGRIITPTTRPERQPLASIML